MSAPAAQLAPSAAGQGGPGWAISRGSVHGVAEISFALRDGATRLAHLYQHEPLRVLFPGPEPGEPPQAVIATTSGGLVAGDRLSIALAAGAGAAAHVTASAAEKIYRSTGATTEIAQSLDIDDAGWLEYLPPETILFDGARLRRQTTVRLRRRGGFLGGGIVVFGRRARGERFTKGLLHDVWEVHHDGALLWGDALHLDGDIAAVIEDPACFAGAAACATLVLVLPGGEAPGLVDQARAVLGRRASGLRAGVTVVNGVLVARWLGPDPLAMRASYADLACHLRAAAMGLAPRLPRLWHV